MVRALAGDSTITSDVVPGSGGGSSSSTLAAVRLARARVEAAFLAAAFRVVDDFRAVPLVLPTVFPVVFLDPAIVLQ